MKFFAKCFGSAAADEPVNPRPSHPASSAPKGKESAVSSTAAKVHSEGLKLKQSLRTTGGGDGNWKKQDLDALPADFSQKAKSTSKIDLSENQLSNLDFDFTVLSASLKELDISTNKLKVLPSSVGSLRNLEILHAYQNELESVPPEICNLVSLKELNVFNNKISEIPSNIGNLGSLELLNLASNQVCDMSLLQRMNTSMPFLKNSVEIVFAP